MNQSLERNHGFNSNNRIFEGYFEESASVARQLGSAPYSFLYIIASWLTRLTSSKAIALLKVVGVALSLVGFIGVIGAVERGALGMGTGALLGVLLIGVEYLCLRKKRRHS